MWNAFPSRSEPARDEPLKSAENVSLSNIQKQLSSPQAARQTVPVTFTSP